MIPNKVRLIQIILESAIPLMGFYMWEWNLYFILLFYFMDLLADEGVLTLKVRDIIKVGRAQWSRTYFWVFTSLISMLLTIGVIHLLLFWVYPAIDFQAEIVRFWTYKELGVEQGYLLFPLLIFAAYQKYKVEYRRPKAYLRIELIPLYTGHMISYVMMVLLALLLYASNIIFQPVEEFYVLAIVLAIAIYKLPARKLSLPSKPNRQ